MPTKRKSRLVVHVPSSRLDFTEKSHDGMIAYGRRRGLFFWLCRCGEGRGFADQNAMMESYPTHLCVMRLSPNTER